MALVVESTSTVTANNATSLTITKPTGVAVGDLLIIASGGTGLSSVPACSGFTTGVTKVQDNSGTNIDLNIILLYRIADASDVSASNYSITGYGASGAGNAAMFRISGWSSGNPFYASATDGGSMDATSATTSQTGLTLVTPASQLLINLTCFYSNPASLSTATFGTYTVTSADSNPTWTEVVDSTVDISGTTAKYCTGVAYANRTATSTITGYSTTISSDANGGSDGYASIFAVIVEPVAAQGTNALLAVDQDTFFANAGATVGTQGSNALHEAGATFFNQSGNATNPTQWTNETKPSTTWTNETR